MNLVQRVQGILISPAKEWGAIKPEKTPIQKLILGYAVPLALIPAISLFLGKGLFSHWYGIGRGLGFAIVFTILNLALVFGIGFVINALAPNFGSKQSQENGMALAVYSMTPFWLAGILFLILGGFFFWLIWIVSLYGYYILYLGFAAPMMDTPKDKQLTYFIISAIAINIGIWLVWVITNAIFPIWIPGLINLIR